MTLIATGDNLRNRSLMGLQAMSREEAEREALYQQMVQQKAAQRSQLAGTGLGIGASYAVNKPESVINLGQKLGLLKAPVAEATITGNFSPITATQMNSTVAGATKTGAEVASVLNAPISSGGSGLSSASVMNAINAPVGQSAFLQTGSGLSATTPAAQAAVNASLANAGVSSAATGAGAAGAGAAGAGAAGAGAGAAGAGAGAAGAGAGAAGAGVGATTAGAASTATAGTAAAGTAASSAGTLATLGTIAAPLAIGVGAFYLLNKLFD